jgi:hypothetical protein
MEGRGSLRWTTVVFFAVSPVSLSCLTLCPLRFRFANGELRREVHVEARSERYAGTAFVTDPSQGWRLAAKFNWTATRLVPASKYAADRTALRDAVPTRRVACIDTSQHPLCLSLSLTLNARTQAAPAPSSDGHDHNGGHNHNGDYDPGDHDINCEDRNRVRLPEGDDRLPRVGGAR